MKGMRNEFWEEEFEDYIFIIFLIYKLKVFLLWQYFGKNIPY